MMIAWRRRTDLLPTHHSQTNPGDGCPWFQQTEHGSVCRHFGSDARLQSRNCTQVTAWVDQIFGSIKGLVVSLVLKSVQNTNVTCKLNFPSLALHHVNNLLVHERSGRLLHATLRSTNSCVSQKVACLKPEDEATIGEAIGLPLVVVANDCAAWLSDNSFGSN